MKIRDKDAQLKKVFVVGQYRDSLAAGEDRAVAWDLQGVFEKEEDAVAACRDEHYFVMPTELNKSLPHEMVVPDEAYYPLAEKKR